MQMQLLLVTVGAYVLANYGIQALECYECNSHNDSQCAEENVPVTLKKDCSDHAEGAKYTMCRKITQVIEFSVNGLPADTRVIRGCAWDESSYKGKCYQRSGFGGRQEVCSCLTDLCNAATINTITSQNLQILISCFLVSTALAFFRN